MLKAGRTTVSGAAPSITRYYSKTKVVKRHFIVQLGSGRKKIKFLQPGAEAREYHARMQKVCQTANVV